MSRKHLLKDMNIKGKRFGNLTALYRTDGDKGTCWRCKCSCGKETTVPIYLLLKNQVKSCGCLKHKPAYNAKDHTGERFGMLVAIERLQRYRGKEIFYRCVCDCGAEKKISSGNLTSGHTRSCGGKNHTRKEFELLNYSLDDKDRLYYVYRHISPSGKSYIGITKQDPERRFRKGAGYKTQKAFYRAIEKYGWESFHHDILEEGLTEKEAYEKEAYYISEVYKSYAPHGYNSREGGVHARHYIMPVIQYFDNKPVNYFEGVNQAVKELGICAATIKKHIGTENAIEGYYFEILPKMMPYNVDVELQELESKEHLRIKDVVEKEWKGNTVQRNISGKKPINQYSLDGKYLNTFSCVKEAAIVLPDGKTDAIYAAVNPKRQGETAYGYMWKYDDGNHVDISQVPYKVQKGVLKIDKETGKVIIRYKSMAEASRELGVSMNKIRIACKGRDSFKDFVLKFNN